MADKLDLLLVFNEDGHTRRLGGVAPDELMGGSYWFDWGKEDVEPEAYHAECTVEKFEGGAKRVKVEIFRKATRTEMVKALIHPHSI